MNREVDLTIIGQLVSAISLLPVYDSDEKAGEFLIALLEDIPGCLRAGVCFRGSTAPYGGQCGDCAMLREQAGGNEPYPCALDGAGNIRAYPFETSARLYGYFVLTVEDAAELGQYEPFLKNLANSLALTLENRRQQRELRASAGILEQRIKERTAELERVLYTASHDLKSPVVTVTSFLGYLEKDMACADHERIAADIGFIRAAAEKMVRLLDDLLSVSRIGRVFGPPERVTLRSMADEALAAAAGKIAGGGVRIQVSGEKTQLHGDRLRLAEIWQNLVDNACKYMGGQKEPLVEIGVEPRGGEQVFFVRDNGLGIEPRFQSKIFGLFEKLDAKTEGTGVGLAIVQRIVGLYGGRIWVESAGQGRGACFYFTLPGALGEGQEEGRRT